MSQSCEAGDAYYNIVMYRRNIVLIVLSMIPTIFAAGSLTLKDLSKEIDNINFLLARERHWIDGYYQFHEAVKENTDMIVKIEAQKEAWPMEEAKLEGQLKDLFSRLQNQAAVADAEQLKIFTDYTQNRTETLQKQGYKTAWPWINTSDIY